MRKKVWNIFVPVAQVLMIVLIAISAYSAGYETVDWKFIPAIFILNFVVVDLMVYKYAEKMGELKRKEFENEALHIELEEQIAHYDKIIDRLDAMSKFRHDFRNYMQTIYELIDRKAYSEAGDMLKVLSEKVKKDRAFMAELDNNDEHDK